jgi:hypothetical protein
MPSANVQEHPNKRADGVLSSALMAEERRFNAGDGVVTLLADEYVLLHFRCSDCRRSTGVGIFGASFPSALDCNEPRRCGECQKRALIRLLRGFGCTIPDDKLLKMSVDWLLSLVGRQEGRT